jgi:hypothetical protein
LDAIGYGLGKAFNPSPSLDDIFKKMGGLSLNVGGTRY